MPARVPIADDLIKGSAAKIGVGKLITRTQVGPDFRALGQNQTQSRGGVEGSAGAPHLRSAGRETEARDARARPGKRPWGG